MSDARREYKKNLYLIDELKKDLKIKEEELNILNNIISIIYNISQKQREVAVIRDLSFTTSKPNYYELHLKMCYKCSFFCAFYKILPIKICPLKVRTL